LKGLTGVLGERLGIDVRLPDPKLLFNGEQSKEGAGEHPACSESNLPVLATCMGLAMKEISQ